MAASSHSGCAIPDRKIHALRINTTGSSSYRFIWYIHTHVFVFLCIHTYVHANVHAIKLYKQKTFTHSNKYRSKQTQRQIKVLRYIVINKWYIHTEMWMYPRSDLQQETRAEPFGPRAAQEAAPTPAPTPMPAGLGPASGLPKKRPKRSQ